MKSTFLKQFIFLAILLGSFQLGFSQQKLRPSQRPYKQELAKFKKMQEERNALIKRMGNRNDISNKRPNVNRPANANNQNSPQALRPSVNQSPTNKAASN